MDQKLPITTNKHDLLSFLYKASLFPKMNDNYGRLKQNCWLSFELKSS